MIPAIVVAVTISLAFLVLVRRLDLYASGASHTVLTCMLGGVAAFLFSFELNSILLLVLLNVLLIRWGLREERAWLRETLNQTVGVLRGEVAVVQELAQLDRLLTPVVARFGTQKRQQVETFLRRQAQLGLKRKVQGMTTQNTL